MTTEVTTMFPLNLIGNGVKMTCETPKAIKPKLLQAYKSYPLNSDFYDSCPKNDKIFKQMLYSISFFDVIVNERKHYKEFGWNIAYEFNRCDFIDSMRQLQSFLCLGKQISFETLQYIIGDCLYGGRIIDEYDKRLLTSILVSVFNDKILKDPFFSLASRQNCLLPRRFEHRMILKYIEETLPNEMNCEFYGLHSNSDFTYGLNNANDLLNSMRITLNAVQTNEHNVIDCLEYLMEINEKLPKMIDISDAAKCQSSYDGSMNAILFAEVEKFNRLLDVICSTCSQLNQAIQGMYLVCSHELDIFEAIFLLFESF